MLYLVRKLVSLVYTNSTTTTTTTTNSENYDFILKKNII